MVVADSGPLIALARIGQLHLLHTLLGTVFIPQAVSAECLGERSRPGSKAITQALKQGWLKKKRTAARALPIGRTTIGEGETAAIKLALQLGCRLLLDDKVARKIAALNEVTVIGTAGVLVKAKQRRLVRKVKPLIDELRVNGYRLSDELVARVLARCREDR